jgi:hypothetical protein
MKYINIILLCASTQIAYPNRLDLTLLQTHPTLQLNWHSNAVLQTSSNLHHWTDLRTSAPFTSDLTPQHQFFRLRLPDFLLINNHQDAADVALLDTQGQPIHTWTNTHDFGGAVYLLNDRSLLKPGRIRNTQPFAGGGTGGNLTQLDWNSQTLWSYTYYSPSNHCAHHDIEPLPNGNILLIAWEYLSTSQAINLGRDPQNIHQSLWPETIVELQPLGTNNALIVWQWHARDHLIQDFNPSLPNYGVISNHPHRININYPPDSSTADWLHFNSIDYHAELDQILISCPTFNEIWIIDHNTTTTEAAGPAGDLLYRWGNPAAYDQGTFTDQQLGYQHDAQWIPTNHPGAGHILLFNNGRHRETDQQGPYSSADEIIPPLQPDGTYAKAPYTPFPPEAPHWTYAATPTNRFFSNFVSSAQRLPTGNTLILAGPQRFLIEVTPQHQIIQQFNIQGAPGFIFRAKKYELDL